MTLTWSEKCVLTDITTQTARNANPNANPPVEERERVDAPTNSTFKITDTTLYVPVVTYQQNIIFFRTIKIRI